MGRPTPLGAVTRGLIAGAVGTAAMDVVQYINYRSGGGTTAPLDWEMSKGLTWETAAAPAQVGKRVVEGAFQTQLPSSVAPAFNNAVHWGYGMAWGAAFGILEGSFRRPRAWHGLPFAVLVFLNGYAVLPLMKLYKPIWEYDATTLGKDLAGHLAYGSGTALTFKLLSDT